MKSLRARLTFWFSLAVTVTAGTAAWIGEGILNRQMLDGLDFLLDAEAQEVVGRLGDRSDQFRSDELHEALEVHTAIDASMYYFQIHRSGHGVVFRSKNLGSNVLPDLSDGGPMTRSLEIGDMHLRLYERHFREFHVQVATSLEHHHAMLVRYQQTLAAGVPLLFALSIGIGWLLSTVALRPIGAMQRSAQRISASNLSERIPVPPGSDEITALAGLLNDLFQRLEASFEQVKRFTADASHELKTPLSLIRLHAERLQRSETLDTAARADVEEQLIEIARLNKLVESLLLLARADAGGLRLECKRLNPVQFIAEFGEDASALAEEAGRVFTIAANGPGRCDFDPGMLRQVLLNLLSNALRHTPARSSIILCSEILNGRWHLTLEDEGPGVPVVDLESIFSRFVHGSHRPPEAPKGSGLGLAIARSIVEAHRGTIHAENRSEGGLRVIVSLPVTSSF